MEELLLSMHHHQVPEPILTPRSNISSLLSASLFSQLYQPIPARHCQRISQADAAKGFHLATAKEGGFKYTFTVKAEDWEGMSRSTGFIVKN